MTDLQDKAISIKGKQYILVSDRVLAFNKDYPKGSIKTSLISSPSADMVVIKAQVTPNCEMPDRYFTGYSQATWGDGMVNKTACLENAETSAVGRALGMMGIGVIESIASADEIVKATGSQGKIASKEDAPASMCLVHNIPKKKFFNPTLSKWEWKHSKPLEKAVDGSVTKWDSCYGQGYESDVVQEPENEPELDF